MTRGHVLLLLFAVPLLPSRAAAEADQRACTDAYEQAQRAKKRGALTEARELLLTCGGPECPELMHEDCGRWLTEVEASLPNAVFEVKSDANVELTDVRIAIDDAEPIPLVGRAVSFDPGPHRVRFEADGYEPVTRELFFSEGQKLRREAVVLKALPTSTPAARVETVDPPEVAASGGGLGAPFFVASSVAVVGAAGFAVFGLRARSDERALARCEPNCTEAQVDETRRNYLLANIGLGVGAAGLVTATILFFVTPSSPPASSKRGVQLGLCERAVGPSVLVGF